MKGYRVVIFDLTHPEDPLAYQDFEGYETNEEIEKKIKLLIEEAAGELLK